jgi:gamma-glutamyltranspeptidase/glutathione hydrolase
MRRTTSVAFVLVALASCAPAPAISPAPAFNKRVEARHGMVSASHPDAASAGAELLRQGGNAVDAAVGVALALGVVDPSQTGLGGGGGLVYWDRQARRAETIDFYPRTGADLDWGRVDSMAARRPINGRAAAIPGTVTGMLEAHARWGRLPLRQVAGPAIRLARDGFIVSPLLSRTIESARVKLEADPAAAALFLPGGQPLRPGDRLVQSELAATLESLVRSGRAGFHEGVLAERAVTKLRDLGSPVTLADWSGYQAAVKPALCSPWLGHTILSSPPPLGGVTVMAALNLLATPGAPRSGSPTLEGGTAVALVNAMRVAAADRRRWRGDPAIFGVPARGMASPAFAAARAGAMATAPTSAVAAGDPWPADAASPGGDCERVGAWPASMPGVAAATPPESAELEGWTEGESFTSHFSIIDRDRNAVSVTFTVGVLFGSGVYVNGYFLNSAANNFDAVTRGPNRFANSTIAPTVILRGEDVRLVIGGAGSAYIPTAVTQVTFRTLALGEDPWLAIAAPRLQPSRLAGVEVEPGFAPEVYAALREHGYLPQSRVADLMFGAVHAVMVMPNGTLVGVADPRRDGVAAGWE